MTAIEKICPDARNLLLIPENHTRNLFYLQNVAQTRGDPAPDRPRTCASDRCCRKSRSRRRSNCPTARRCCSNRCVRSEYRLGLDGFDPCAILLNNDLSAGIPEILQNLNEQFILPPLHAGWAVRRKSNHFAAYDEVADNFAKLVGIDPWRINPYFLGLRQRQFPRAAGRGMPGRQCRRRTRYRPREVQGIRHRRDALRSRQGRRRHLRHGRDDGARMPTKSSA